jgi:hypothetical protein
MKQTFPGYYRPTPTEFSDLWTSARFALDANVLLNLYGYSSTTRKRLLELLESVGPRLWMPHQFAFEFQRNRAKAILEQVENYKTIAAQFTKVLDQHLKPTHRHPFITKRSMTALETIRRELDKGRRQHEALLSDDPIFDKMTSLLTGRVGAAPDRQSLDGLHDEARRRYGAKIPPGYADMEKPEPDRFGDYVGWRQILDHGTKEACSLVLVTDDLKEDWWSYTRGDRTIGPRPELIAEYLEVCKKPFYMYTLEQFIRYAQDRFGRRVGQAALDEVRQRSEERVGAFTAKPLETGPAERVRLQEHSKPKSDKPESGSIADRDTTDLDEPKTER